MKGRTGWILRTAAALLAAVLLLPCGTGRAQREPSDLIEAAFELLEDGNPFVRRYEEQTGRKIEPLFPYGVPYFYGGLSGAKGNGWFYMASRRGRNTFTAWTAPGLHGMCTRPAAWRHIPACRTS